MANTGIVVIGRNEGERLVRCLESLGRQLSTQDLLAVYVDSGSTDNSVSQA
ncbi:MAG: glycosyltransferase, partial [Cyanobacteriota bacterium]|nr:glycosyltransferase [Cyanobacteriota bacterium]